MDSIVDPRFKDKCFISEQVKTETSSAETVTWNCRH